MKPVVPQSFATLAPSAARTANGNGDAIDLTQVFGQLAVGLAPFLIVQSRVTAFSGTSPTLTVIIEDSVDGGATWNTIISLTAQTGVSSSVGRLGLTAANWPFNPRKIRARWTIGGTTPSFTFAVVAVML